MIGVYVWVSSKRQETRSQEPDLQAWAKAQREPVKWYRDKATGRSMDRPGFQAMYEAARLGQVNKFVVWRLDRLGRTAGSYSTCFTSSGKRRPASCRCATPSTCPRPTAADARRASRRGGLRD